MWDELREPENMQQDREVDWGQVLFGNAYIPHPPKPEPPAKDGDNPLGRIDLTPPDDIAFGDPVEAALARLKYGASDNPEADVDLISDHLDDLTADLGETEQDLEALREAVRAAFLKVFGGVIVMLPAEQAVARLADQAQHMTTLANQYRDEAFEAYDALDALRATSMKLKTTYLRNAGLSPQAIMETRQSASLVAHMDRLILKASTRGKPHDETMLDVADRLGDRLREAEATINSLLAELDNRNTRRRKSRRC